MKFGDDYPAKRKSCFRQLQQHVWNFQLYDGSYFIRSSLVKHKIPIEILIPFMDWYRKWIAQSKEEKENLLKLKNSLIIGNHFYMRLHKEETEKE